MRYVVAFLLLLAAGCGSDGSPFADMTGAGCTKDTDCKGDRICVAGACVNPPSVDGAAADLSMLPDVAMPDLVPPTDLATAPDLTPPPPDLTPPPPDLAPTCGIKGIRCCPGSACNDGSFCSFDWCQTTCGLTGKIACDGPEPAHCAPGLVRFGNQGVAASQQGLACTGGPLYCLIRNGCGYIGDPCCDQNGQPWHGAGPGLCDPPPPGGAGAYCNQHGKCAMCNAEP